MDRRIIITGVIIGIGIIFAASIYTAVLPRLKRKRRSLPELLADIERLRAEAVRISDEHPERLNRALETTFQQYAQHTLIIEGVAADDTTIACIREATNYVMSDFVWGRVTEANIRTVHAHIMLREKPEIAGQFRDHDVFIRDSGIVSTFPHHATVPALIEEFLEWLNQQPDTIETRFLVAAEAKLRYVSIHPHSDGNGRTSRAIMNGLLCQTRAVPYVAIPYTISKKYFAELRQAQKTNNSENFVKFILRLVEQTYETFIEQLSSNQNP